MREVAIINADISMGVQTPFQITKILKGKNRYT